jgi:hypothetical protein
MADNTVCGNAVQIPESIRLAALTVGYHVKVIGEAFGTTAKGKKPWSCRIAGVIVLERLDLLLCVLKREEPVDV